MFILLDLSEGARVEGIAKRFTNSAGAQSAEKAGAQSAVPTDYSDKKLDAIIPH